MEECLSQFDPARNRHLSPDELEILFINFSLSKAQSTEPKKILFWTGYYDRKDMVFGFGREPFEKAKCKVTNCWATDDRSQLNGSDAVIFHAGDFKTNDLPAHRLPSQRYVFCK